MTWAYLIIRYVACKIIIILLLFPLWLWVFSLRQTGECRFSGNVDNTTCSTPRPRPLWLAETLSVAGATLVLRSWQIGKWKSRPRTRGKNALYVSINSTQEAGQMFSWMYPLPPKSEFPCQVFRLFVVSWTGQEHAAHWGPAPRWLAGQLCISGADSGAASGWSKRGMWPGIN